MGPITSAYRSGTMWGVSLGLPVVLLLTIAAVTVSGIPTSVLANAKESNAYHGSEAASNHQSQESRNSATSGPTEGKTQISVPQKRGVNPLLYNNLDYSGNSIPRDGLWDEQDGPPLALGAGPPVASLFPDQLGGGGRESRLRNYDVLASLLSPPPQTFYREPATPSISYPYMWLGDRNKRMVNQDGKSYQRPLRPKRSPAKLTPADALSLLALLDSRDPYPSMSDYFPLVPANGPNDVLPYSPNSVYQDVPLSLALAQLGARSSGNVGPLAPYSDDDGEWMNTWAEPAVDYLGFPLDVDTLSRLDGYGTKPTKNGFSPQKRFMITKRKRSVSLDADDDCKNDKKSCLLRKYGQLPATKVSSA